jgi:hypothetical protein
MMHRRIGIFAVLLATVTPHAAIAGRCGIHCPLPVKVVPVIPVTTIIEIAVPVTAVSFSYIAPQLPQAPPRQQSDYADLGFAAEPFESFGRVVRGQGVAGVLQSRCYSCHGQAAKGGVRLWDAAGNLQPSKAGAPLSRYAVLDQVRAGRMPPTGELALAEKETVASWAMVE